MTWGVTGWVFATRGKQERSRQPLIATAMKIQNSMPVSDILPLMTQYPQLLTGHFMGLGDLSNGKYP